MRDDDILDILVSRSLADSFRETYHAQIISSLELGSIVEFRIWRTPRPTVTKVIPSSLREMIESG